VKVTAHHAAEAIAGGTRVTLSICYEGLLVPLLARWVGNLNERYLEMEIAGLKARCTARDPAYSNLRLSRALS
jgi:hypothetical protein